MFAATRIADAVRFTSVTCVLLRVTESSELFAPKAVSGSYTFVDPLTVKLSVQKLESCDSKCLIFGGY